MLEKSLFLKQWFLTISFLTSLCLKKNNWEKLILIAFHFRDKNDFYNNSKQILQNDKSNFFSWKNLKQKHHNIDFFNKMFFFFFKFWSTHHQNNKRDFWWKKWLFFSSKTNDPKLFMSLHLVAWAFWRLRDDVVLLECSRDGIASKRVFISGILQTTLLELYILCFIIFIYQCHHLEYLQKKCRIS